jgi:hypothetical protein
MSFDFTSRFLCRFGERVRRSPSKPPGEISFLHKFGRFALANAVLALIMTVAVYVLR